MVREMRARLAEAKAAAHMILPLKGIQEWDRAGQPAHSPEGMEALIDEIRKNFAPLGEFTGIDAHINDPEFCGTVVSVFDRWLEAGIIGKQAAA